MLSRYKYILADNYSKMFAAAPGIPLLPPSTQPPSIPVCHCYFLSQVVCTHTYVWPSQSVMQSKEQIKQ